MFRWGLVPFWAKDVKIGYSLMNTKAEAVASNTNPH
jgi:putative SOS response-associated peptidase YedK